MNVINVNQRPMRMQQVLLFILGLWSCCGIRAGNSSLTIDSAAVSSNAEVDVLLNVVHFGADPTGVSLSNLAVQLAFQAASETIGATVVFPRGTYLLQPLQLSHSNVHIHFEDGATWQAVQDEEYIRRPPMYSRNDPLLYYSNEQDYDTSTDMNQMMYYWPITPAMVTYGGGREDGWPMRYEAFFSITAVANVTISGHGIINGAGPVWWYLFDQHALPYTRPSLVEIRHSSNIVIHGIRLEKSPFWSLHFYNTSNVLVHDIHIHNEMLGEYEGVEYLSHNVDGIDINSCKHVIIKDSIIHTHDDAVVIKSGMDLAGLKASLPSHDILVHNVTTKATVGAGLGIGSEVSGGITNVTFSNCTVYGSLYGIRVKTSHGRGSTISNVTFHDINIITSDETQYGQTSAITVSMFGGNRPSFFKGYRWSDITMIENLLFDMITIFPSDHKISNAPRSIIDASTNTEELPKGSNPLSESASWSAIYVTGDTNLRRYWFSPFHSSSSNDYIRNVTFRNLINYASDDYTVVKSGNQVTTASTKHAQIPSNLYCINAVKIRFDDYEILCEDKPYEFFSYCFDQIGRALSHAVSRARGRRRVKESSVDSKQI